MLLTDMSVPRSLGFGKGSRSSMIESAEKRLEGGLDTSLAVSGATSSVAYELLRSAWAAKEDFRSGTSRELSVGMSLASEEENRPKGSGDSGIIGDSVVSALENLL